MVVSKFIVLALFLCFLGFYLVEANQPLVGSSGPKMSKLGMDCGTACVARCQLSSRPNLCHRACGTCCSRCGCVPPGTSGNQDMCPCYYNQTTHGGQRKCP